jgi:hypothetical protein
MTTVRYCRWQRGPHNDPISTGVEAPAATFLAIVFRGLAAALAAISILLGCAPSAGAQGAMPAQGSANWSGYVAANAYYTGVQALIQAPTPAASQQLGTVASWVGIGGAETTDLIQAGIQELTVGDTISYNAWYEILPQVSRNVALTIGSGDWVQVDIHEQAWDLWQITIVDGPHVFQIQLPYHSSHSSAEWIVEQPSLVNGRQLPLASISGANFGQMSAIANGHPANPSQLSVQPIVLVSRTNQVKSAPSPLGHDGVSFTVITS